MKIAILGDPHFGARNDSEIVRKFQEDFYLKCFFPKLAEHRVKHVVNMGDTFDRRKYINFGTLNHCKKFFFEPMVEKDINCSMIVGNHDTHYKNTNFLNSPDLLLSEYSNLAIYSEVGEMVLGSTKRFHATIIPWINSENEKSTLEYIAKDRNRVAFGHLELSGFEMDPGIVCTEGMSADLFRKYDQVFSGHFHHKSQSGNIFYVGNPYELTWSDCGDIRGFHIYDTNDGKLEFIENPFKLFHKVVYNDETSKPQVPDIDLSSKYVKIILVKKTNPVWFDHFFDVIFQQSPADLQIVEPSQMNLDVEMDEEDLKNAVKDSRQFLRDYVQETGIVPTKDEEQKLIEYMDNLYVEAMNEC